MHTQRMETPMQTTKSINFYDNSIPRGDIVFGVRFRKCVLPQGLAKEAPKIMKIPKSLCQIGYTMILTTSRCDFDAKPTVEALEHLPEPFRMFFQSKSKGDNEIIYL